MVSLLSPSSRVRGKPGVGGAARLAGSHRSRVVGQPEGAGRGMATLRRRKGGSAGGDAVGDDGVADGGDAAGAVAAPARARRQPTVAENLARWGYVCSVVGQMFSAVWQLLVAAVLWVCPLCAREEKRQLR